MILTWKTSIYYGVSTPRKCVLSASQHWRYTTGHIALQILLSKIWSVSFKINISNVSKNYTREGQYWQKNCKEKTTGSLKDKELSSIA